MEGHCRRMKFRCDNCNHRLSVADSRAGKKGRCPHCGQTLIVPDLGMEPADVPTGPKPSLRDGRFLDLSLAESSDRSEPPNETDKGAQAFEYLQSLQGGPLNKTPDEVPQRKLPWVIDIFLYPMNRAALIILGICAGGPFLLRVLITFFRVATSQVQIMIIFWLVSLIVHYAALFFLLLYMNWYLWECIRDSAGGGIRAAETVGATPGFGEIIGQAFKSSVCAGLCLAPAVFYLGRVQAFDTIFWTLLGLAGFLLPMTLLAMVMHDAFSALNPALIIRSILRTFFSYFFLVPLCCVPCVLLPLAYYLIFNKRYWHWSYALQFAAFYLMLVMGHLLGRFYFKNDEKLYWDT